MTKLEWQTVYAGDEPIVRYEILHYNIKVGEVAYKPQVTRDPFTYTETLSNSNAHNYRVLTVDSAGRKAETEDILISEI